VTDKHFILHKALAYSASVAQQEATSTVGSKIQRVTDRNNVFVNKKVLNPITGNHVFLSV